MSDRPLTLGEVVRRFAEPFLERHGATTTSAQRAVLRTLGRCRTAALGGHLYRCEDCGREHPAYNSCRGRHCPSCLGHKSAKWLEARAAELLPVPYFHVVFTLPEALRPLALGNKETVYGMLFSAASASLRDLAADPRRLGADIGMLAVLHTWTQTLGFHPHLHCVVPGGGLSPDGSRWVACREGYLLPVKVLSRVFAGKFGALLDRARERGELSFGGSTRQLDDIEAWRRWRGRLRREAWVVYAKPPFGSPALVLKYLARYTHRVAISNRRLVSVDDEHVTFSYRDRRRDGARSEMTLGGVEFLRRFVLHVLPKGFTRVRFYGLLSTRRRTTALPRCRHLLAVREPAPAGPDGARPGPRAHSELAEPSEPRPPPTRRCPHCDSDRLRLLLEIPAEAKRARGPP